MIPDDLPNPATDPAGFAAAVTALRAEAIEAHRRAAQMLASAVGHAEAARIARRHMDALAPAKRRRGRPTGAKLRWWRDHRTGRQFHEADLVAEFHRLAPGLSDRERRALPLKIARRHLGTLAVGADDLADRIRHLVAELAAQDEATRRAVAAARWRTLTFWAAVFRNVAG